MKFINRILTAIFLVALWSATAQASASLYSQNSQVVNPTATSASTTVSANTGDAVIARVLYYGSTYNALQTTLTVNGNAASLVGVNPANNIAITFSTAPSGSSGSTTIGSNWTNLGGTYPVLLSTGQLVNFTFTNSSTTVTWATTINGSPTTSASAFYSTTYNVVYFVASNVASGTLTVAASNITANLGAISAIDVTGVASSAFQTFMLTQGGASGSGANAIAANSVAATAPAFISAFCWDTQAGSAAVQTAGTTLAWNSETATWTNLVNLTNTSPSAVGEWLDVSSSGNTVATFGANSSIQYNNFLTGVVVLNGYVAPASPYQPSMLFTFP